MVFSIRDIEAGEEICFNYRGEYLEDEPDEGEEQETDKRSDPVYAICRCGAKNCTGKLFR